MEGYASNYYLLSSFMVRFQRTSGCAGFYTAPDEERMHMMKIFNYVNDAGVRSGSGH